MPSWLSEWLRAIERTSVGDFVRSSPYLYPVLESLHILGIALMVGAAIAVDLRLVGFGRAALPVTIVTRHLLRLSHVGFAIVASTGLLMFTGIAFGAASSPAAPWKFGLIVVAGVNILVFHFGIYRTVATWDKNVRPPLAAQVSGLVSACSWTGVIIAGRFLAY
jgi:hypothetical protein